MITNSPKDVVGVASHDFFSGPMRSVLVFAARYTHRRNTGGALAVVRSLEQCWHLLDDHTREQILRESQEAECNADDWQRLMVFAVKYSSDKDQAQPDNQNQPSNT